MNQNSPELPILPFFCGVGGWVGGQITFLSNSVWGRARAPLAQSLGQSKVAKFLGIAHANVAH